MNDPEVSFQIGRVLGSGTFGKVFEAMNTKNGEFVAVKRIELNSVNKSKVRQMIALAENEIDMMRKLRHPNIVGVKGSAFDGNTFNIIMELVAGRSLSDMLQTIGPFHENVCRKYTRQLLLALEYCHKLKCTHRDIKGKNILLTTTGTVRICDFGSAKIREAEDEEGKSVVDVTYSYTPLWLAPEALITKRYDEKVDIWALGCVVIEMGSGRDPWFEKHFKDSYQALSYIAESGEIPAIPPTLSALGQEFVRRCLVRDPDQRPTAAQLLKHPWVATEDELRRPTFVPTPQTTPAQSRTTSDASSAQAASAASPPAAAASPSAEEQIKMLSMLVETKVQTSKIQASMSTQQPPPSTEPLMVKTRRAAPPPPPPPPPPEEEEMKPAPNAAVAGHSPTSFPPPPPPYPYAHSDANVSNGVSPSKQPMSNGNNIDLTGSVMNVIYTFGPAAGAAVVADDGHGHGQGRSPTSVGEISSGSEGSLSISAASCTSSRIFHTMTPPGHQDLSCSGSGTGSGSGNDREGLDEEMENLQLSSSVLSFVDGYDSNVRNLANGHGQEQYHYPPHSHQHPLTTH